jgi:RNA polymerase sigma factor (TIGR02999 family)
VEAHDPLEESFDALLAGSEHGAETLFKLTYEELRRRAAALLAQERPDHTLVPTALVHEVWIRVARDSRVRLRGRPQFLAIAARAMRQLLIDHARKRNTLKRGEPRREELHSQIEFAPGVALDGFELADALVELERRHARPSRVATAHLFGGLTLEEVAGIERVSHDTIREDWRFARNWLHRRLGLVRPQGGASA